MEKQFLLIMLGTGLLLVFSVLASKIASRIGVPILLIFIGVGMLTGVDGIGGVAFDNYELTRTIGTMALVFILFSGGLSTSLESIFPVYREGLILATVGVLISAVFMGYIIHWVMDWPLLHSMLLGATISSTDAAAVFGILRTKKLGLKPKLQSLLEFESGSNDPMAVFLTLLLIQLLLSPQDVSWGNILISFGVQMSLGALFGWVLGKGVVRLINWLDLQFEGLYPVLTIAAVICIFSFTEWCGGNGFLSVYVAGLAMGNGKYFSKKILTFFHDGLAWLMQSTMFMTMGLLITPSEVLPLAGEGIVLSFALMLVARPLSVWLCVLPFRYHWREVWFLSWGGLRGAVPIIMATYLLVEQVPNSKVMFNIIFFIVIITMLVEGSSIGLMSKWMRVQQAFKPARKLPFKSRHTHSEFIEFFIGTKSSVIGKSIFQLHLPKDVLVVLVHRQGNEFIPRGNTTIEVYDRLVCLAAKSSIPTMEAIMGSEHFYERRIGV